MQANTKLIASAKKELLALQKRENRMERSALKATTPEWKQKLESKIPQKVYSGLESAFCKAFSVVFNQGSSIIEKGCNKENAKADFAVKDYAVQVKGGRRELKQLQKGASQSNLLNLAITSAEGVGLGALGIGMPDIVLFIGMLLKGIYETALNYGYGYESIDERYLILKMMAASLSTGEEWRSLNKDVDNLLSIEAVITEEQFQAQLKATASVFAMDMLLLKFIQGLPVVGIIGGAANPVYYSKVMKYVQLKYRKRYLMKITHS